MKRSLLIVAVVAFALSTAWVVQSQAKSQDAQAVDAFLLQVDVDGDGENTPGDRAVVEWWIAHGGSADTIMNAAVTQGDLRDVRSFFESPAAQLGQ